MGSTSTRLLLLLGVLGLVFAQDESEEGGDGKSQKEIAGQYGYCMESNCYDLLGVTKESEPVAIKLAYRRLAKAWHPDKTSHPDKTYAKNLFQTYANAYDVLSSKEMRGNYDYVLDHPYEFPMHFLRMNSAKYAPKSDVRTVFITVFLFVSALHYLYQLQHVKQTLKSIKSRPQYQERLKTIMAELAGRPASTKPRFNQIQAAGSSKGKGSAANKGAEFEERARAAEELIAAELADVLPHAPMLQDTLAFAIFTAPLTCSRGLVWNVSWFLKFRVLGQEYGDDEMEYLTQKALGVSAKEWGTFAEDHCAELMGRELWLADNLAAYEEETAGPRGNKNDKKKMQAKQLLKEKKAAKLNPTVD